jgi:hypothetical protein
VVVVDRSGSRTPQQMADMRAAMDAIARATCPGDELSFVVVMADGSDQIDKWTLALPAPRRPDRMSPRELREFSALRVAASARAKYYATSLKVVTQGSTDLLRTLGRVAEMVGDGRKVPVRLYVLSDMLNYSSELKMERLQDIPDNRWIAARQKEGRLPRLAGACVAVGGAETATRRGVRVREFWRAYFTAVGATLADYREAENVPTNLSCSRGIASAHRIVGGWLSRRVERG